jgi:hypothetical protein
MMSCPISINSLGFRGPEISASKDGAYRIVVLGESTTFGMTLQPEDQPWPEVLEQIIRQRLKTRRPVQVINAGVPAYTSTTIFSRLPGEILPLQPDMIISYHGANGFHMIDSSVLPPVGPAPPVTRNVPSSWRPTPSIACACCCSDVRPAREFAARAARRPAAGNTIRRRLP